MNVPTRFLDEVHATAETKTPLALPPREAAKALGISERLLWQLTKDGKVPCVRLGDGKRKSVLYPLAQLQEWLKDQSTRNLRAVS